MESTTAELYLSGDIEQEADARDRYWRNTEKAVPESMSGYWIARLKPPHRALLQLYHTQKTQIWWKNISDLSAAFQLLTQRAVTLDGHRLQVNNVRSRLSKVQGTDDLVWLFLTWYSEASNLTVAAEILTEDMLRLRQTGQSPAYLEEVKEVLNLLRECWKPPESTIRPPVSEKVMGFLDPARRRGWFPVGIFPRPTGPLAQALLLGENASKILSPFLVPGEESPPLTSPELERMRAELGRLREQVKQLESRGRSRL